MQEQILAKLGERVTVTASAADTGTTPTTTPTTVAITTTTTTTMTITTAATTAITTVTTTETATLGLVCMQAAQQVRPRSSHWNRHQRPVLPTQ